MSSSASEITGTATVLPPDVLDDVTRARLRDVVNRHDPVVDARRWAKVVFLVLTLLVWFPTWWSGTKAAETAMPQWGGAIALSVAVFLVLQTANRYAKENATQILRRDSIARSIAAAEKLAEQQKSLEEAKARLKAEVERKAEEERAAKEARIRARLAAADVDPDGDPSVDESQAPFAALRDI